MIQTIFLFALLAQQPAQPAAPQVPPTPRAAAQVDITGNWVALVTEDFRLYHALAPLFEHHGLSLLGIAPGQPIPPAVRAVLGGPAGDVDRKSVV